MEYLIDTHFHIDHYKDYQAVAEKINTLKQYTLCVTNSPGIFVGCKSAIQETKYLKFALGFHPLESQLREEDYRSFIRFLEQTNYIGEIGLDYSKFSKIERPTQLHFFESIVAQCAAQNKLMTVHIRQAEADAIEIIRRYSPPKCIIHWFTGSERHLLELLGLGCYMSVNSNMIISKNRDKYLAIPKDKILVESDGPYTKVAGKRFSPELLQQSYQLISEFFGYRDLAATVKENFQRLLCQ